MIDPEQLDDAALDRELASLEARFRPPSGGHLPPGDMPAIRLRLSDDEYQRRDALRREQSSRQPRGPQATP